MFLPVPEPTSPATKQTHEDPAHEDAASTGPVHKHPDDSERISYSLRLRTSCFLPSGTLPPCSLTPRSPPPCSLAPRSCTPCPLAHNGPFTRLKPRWLWRVSSFTLSAARWWARDTVTPAEDGGGCWLPPVLAEQGELRCGCGGSRLTASRLVCVVACSSVVDPTPASTCLRPA